MHIPSELQHFPKPSLIIISDHYRARFVKVEGENLEELDEVAEPRAVLADTADALIPLEDSMMDEDRLKHFVKKVAVRLDALVAEQNVSIVHLVIPADMDRALQQQLGQATLACLGKGKVLHAELMKEPTVSVLERLVALF